MEYKKITHSISSIWLKFITAIIFSSDDTFVTDQIWALLKSIRKRICDLEFHMGFDAWYKNNSTRKKNLNKIPQTHREILSSFSGYFIRKSLFFDYLNSGSEFGFHLKYNLCSRTMLIQIMSDFHVKTLSVFHRPSPTWPYFNTFVLKSQKKLFRLSDNFRFSDTTLYVFYYDQKSCYVLCIS